MIGSAYEACISCIVYVFLVVLVQKVSSFCCLDDDEAHRLSIKDSIFQSVPVHLPLVMRNINTSDRISLGISTPVETFPTQGERTHQKMIEHKGIDHPCKYGKQPLYPLREEGEARHPYLLHLKFCMSQVIGPHILCISFSRDISYQMVENSSYAFY